MSGADKQPDPAKQTIQMTYQPEMHRTIINYPDGSYDIHYEVPIIGYDGTNEMRREFRKEDFAPAVLKEMEKKMSNKDNLPPTPNK